MRSGEMAIFREKKAGSCKAGATPWNLKQRERVVYRKICKQVWKWIFCKSNYQKMFLVKELGLICAKVTEDNTVVNLRSGYTCLWEAPRAWKAAEEKQKKYLFCFGRWGLLKDPPMWKWHECFIHIDR